MKRWPSLTGLSSARGNRVKFPPGSGVRKIFALSQSVCYSVVMKQTILGFLAGTVVTGALTFAIAQSRNPRLSSAHRALSEARMELRESRHDYCGHKVRAIQAVDAALGQIRLAMDCSRY